MGLVASVEFDTSDTLSPMSGADGNQEKEALGAPGGCTDAVAGG
jgi:hypothetical protein